MRRTLTAREFVGVVGGVSASFVVISILISESHIFLKLLFAHLAAIGVTGAIATAFFSYREVKESVAGGLASLVIDGRIVAHLTRRARRRLRERTVMADLGGSVRRLPDDLISLTEH